MKPKHAMKTDPPIDIENMPLKNEQDMEGEFTVRLANALRNMANGVLVSASMLVGLHFHEIILVLCMATARGAQTKGIQLATVQRLIEKYYRESESDRIAEVN